PLRDHCANCFRASSLVDGPSGRDTALQERAMSHLIEKKIYWCIAGHSRGSLDQLIACPRAAGIACAFDRGRKRLSRVSLQQTQRLRGRVVITAFGGLDQNLPLAF